ncbi:MAG: hypothetical protein WCE44_02760 [Candidatus Velthaea sp.]
MSWPKGKPRPLATRARQSAAGKKAWADPELRARQSEGLKKAWADSELRARQSAVSKKAWADPEKRARRSAALKKAWADPELRARQSAAVKKAWADPELRARQSERLKKAWADPVKPEAIIVAVPGSVVLTHERFHADMELATQQEAPCVGDACPFLIVDRWARTMPFVYVEASRVVRDRSTTFT